MSQKEKTQELRIELWGRVQGVSLRYNVRKQAENLGLKGFVLNRSDGSVLCVAQGREENLLKMLSWCQKPTFPARVTGMSYRWTDPEDEFAEFTIEREDSFFKDQAKSFYNLGKEMLSASGEMNVPNHVVIIPDGNRRWARSKGWKPWVGHKKAAKFERVKKMLDECKRLGVKYLTLWVWSSENWERSEEEQKAIFDIFRGSIDKLTEELMNEQIRFRHLGRKDRLSKDIVSGLEELEEQTKGFSKFNFQLCMDYGGRDEIVRAVRRMMDDGVKDISEETFTKYLDSADIPDPDLVIRTSGEKRTSGIMPYQAAYAELYFTEIPFPEFGAEEFRRAILEYSGRTRRFGGTVESDLKNIDQDALIDPDAQRSKVSPSVSPS